MLNEEGLELVIHPRINKLHPEIKDEDVRAAYLNALRSMPREATGFPPQWVGVGVDGHGRLLQFVAVNERPNRWLIFHAMHATTKVLRELGIRR